MISALRGLAIAAFIGAAICVPIVVVMHHSLMPDAAQLAQIDSAAQAAAPTGCIVRRLRAPDRIESDGHAKSGYFTYEVTGNASGRYMAEWRITDKHVELLSFKRL